MSRGLRPPKTSRLYHHVDPSRCTHQNPKPPPPLLLSGCLRCNPRRLICTTYYLDGFPIPDPKYAETILAVPCSASGSNIEAKERKRVESPASFLNKRTVNTEAINGSFRFGLIKSESWLHSWAGLFFCPDYLILKFALSLSPMISLRKSGSYLERCGSLDFFFIAFSILLSDILMVSFSLMLLKCFRYIYTRARMRRLM